MSYSLITERRRHAPQGRAGGSAGQPGRNLVDGEEVPVEGDAASCVRARRFAWKRPAAGVSAAPGEDSGA